MNIVDTPPVIVSAPLVDSPAPKGSPAGRPLRKRVMQLIRRGHLYFGLFLFPWAVLYGVTAFLFNHPTAFSDRDQAMKTYGREATAGTPLDGWPTADEQAAEVVKLLNAKQSPATPYTLAGPAKLTRDNAFATIKADGQNLNLLFDVKAGGGTITSRAAPPDQPRKEPERAPFAVGRQPTNDGPGRGGRGGPGGGGGGGRGGPGGGEGRGGRGEGRGEDGIKLDNPPHERLKAAVPVVLERSGLPTGEVTVTSVPDVTFPIEADGKVWTATYNPLTGGVSGKPADADDSKPDVGWRRFLTRLHTTHGYPGETNAKWFWAVVVDVMAFVMCFWGVSGLLMWWQLKGTRRVGFVILVLSAAAAAGLGFAMHAAMAG